MKRLALFALLAVAALLLLARISPLQARTITAPQPTPAPVVSAQ